MDFTPIWVNLKPGATETETTPKHFGRKPYGRNNGRYYGREAYGRTLLRVYCRSKYIYQPKFRAQMLPICIHQQNIGNMQTSCSPKYVQFEVLVLDHAGDVLHVLEGLLVDGVGAGLRVGLVVVGGEAEVEHRLEVHHGLLLDVGLLVGVVLPMLGLSHQFVELECTLKGG